LKFARQPKSIGIPVSSIEWWRADLPNWPRKNKKPPVAFLSKSENAVRAGQPTVAVENFFGDPQRGLDHEAKSIRDGSAITEVVDVTMCSIVTNGR
jgi:hypothetical protein